MKAKRIIFISNSTYPLANTGGGSVVVYRHFKRLQQSGHPVLIINFFNQQINESQQKGEFEAINLNKKWWYPPLRINTPLLTALRMRLSFNELKNKLDIGHDDILIGLFGEYSNVLAMQIAKQFGNRLYMIYHDDCLFNQYGPYNLLTPYLLKQVIKYTTHVFAVSKPMKTMLLKNGIRSSSVVFPIPEGYNKKIKAAAEVNFNNLKFAFSGLLFDDLHFEILQNISSACEAINGNIDLIGDLPADLKRNLNSIKNIHLTERIATTAGLFDYIIKNIDVLLVFYSFKLENEHRMFTSFPSKFTEYCHLGLPVLIIAPPVSSIGKWAIENNWLCYVPVGEKFDIFQIMDKLRDRSFWTTCRDQALETARTKFNPTIIHSDFFNTINEPDHE